MLGFLPWCYGALLVFYPVLVQLVSSRDAGSSAVTRSYGFRLGHFQLDSWPLGLAVSGAGVLVLAAGPWLTHAVLGLDRWLLPRLLGPPASSLRISELEETRQHAINEAAGALRHIERDLHGSALPTPDSTLTLAAAATSPAICRGTRRCTSPPRTATWPSPGRS